LFIDDEFAVGRGMRQWAVFADAVERACGGASRVFLDALVGRLLKQLVDPTRLRVIDRLGHAGPASVTRSATAR